MIDAEKWQASKENERFSDRQTTEIKGKIDVEHQKVDDLELARWVAHVLTNGVRAQEKLGGVLDISKLIDGSNATDIEGE